jgi:GrpB-like predicted nucleotidyltransferase (UPF0157 family)
MTQIHLHSYTRIWALKFRKEQALLKLLLGDVILDIQHIGSTSIPGMVARPIIDILLSISDYDTGYEQAKIIERLGYQYVGENSELRQYLLTKGDPTTYHLYVVERENKTWKTRIVFRDWIKYCTHAARDYADIKRRLSRQFSQDLITYQKEKGDFIQRTLREAENHNHGD